MKRKGFLQTACTLTAALLLLAGCTQNELFDGQGEPLPEGKYPLTFTATQGEPVASPQTRVSDYGDADGNHKSKWTTGDRIKVVVSAGGNAMETTCTLDANGNITGYDSQLYWKTTQTSKINSWYSNITGQATTSNTVNLADQSSGLAYVLKAEEKTDVNYRSDNISLSFKHQHMASLQKSNERLLAYIIQRNIILRKKQHLIQQKISSPSGYACSLKTIG